MGLHDEALHNRKFKSANTREIFYFQMNNILILLSQETRLGLHNE